MLPDVHDLPAELLELCVLRRIPGHVAIQLFSPPITVVLWQVSVIGTGVPEASVYKDGYTSRSEGEIRAPRERGIIYAKSEAATVQLTPYEHFRRGGGPAHFLHLRGDVLI